MMQCIGEPGCTKPVKIKSRSMCSNHYQSWRKKNLPKNPRACSISNCSNPMYAKELCRSHYNRKRATGSALLRRDTAPVECQITDCSNLATAKNLCKNHYMADWNAKSWGKGLNRGHHNFKREVGYQGAHNRVYKHRGRASEQNCVDCFLPGEEWSLTHHSENWRVETAGKMEGAEFSLDPFDYEPRCKSHHRQHDFPNGYKTSPRPGRITYK